MSVKCETRTKYSFNKKTRKMGEVFFKVHFLCLLNMLFFYLTLPPFAIFLFDENVLFTLQYLIFTSISALIVLPKKLISFTYECFMFL